MTTPRPTPTTVAEHLAGPAQAWHGKITTDGPFTPEKDRYRLYIGLFCPFAHRVNIIRHLKNLQSIIPITVVKPYPKGDASGWPGWAFPSTPEEYPGATPDPLFSSSYLHELYFKADPNFKGRYSAPLLWDTKTSTIVNNESLELLRDFSTCFNPILSPEDEALTLYPSHLQSKINLLSAWLQKNLCTGVYRAGFARTQIEYNSAVIRVFAALNILEQRILSSGPYIFGSALTEVDVLAYATLIRFDTVYVQHFKCNLGTIRHDYPRVKNWLGNLYWNVKGFKETTDFKHIKENYTKSHGDINPLGITPLGPWPDVEGREQGWVYEEDWGKVKVAGVRMGEVEEVKGEMWRELGL
ncbi:glutathione S-transferase [Podospora fimiseda]|uniref:Glutathione S-transferase n=1 Tax=Podospora fimiseda TaxID=252190 RepID=A0AAN7BFD7_9PEZI|nr:glutathione S-transferase [Podospora fimiseda]